MKYQIATKWQELNEWQLNQLAYFYFSLRDQQAITQASFLQLLGFVFVEKPSFWQRVKFYRLIKNTPTNQLEPFVDFIFKEPTLYNFPEIKGLVRPADRLGDLTIKQYSVCDALFYRWQTTKNDVFLRQLVASLYRFDGVFCPQKLPKIAEITDKISLKQAMRIGLAFFSIRLLIINKYPQVFPPPKPETDEMVPVFTSKRDYLPFSKLISVMALDEIQPLGNFNQCSQTLVYDFFEILSESIILSKKQNNA